MNDNDNLIRPKKIFLCTSVLGLAPFIFGYGFVDQRNAYPFADAAMQETSEQNLIIVDVKEENPIPARSVKNDIASSLGDPQSAPSFVDDPIDQESAPSLIEVPIDQQIAHPFDDAPIHENFEENLIIVDVKEETAEPVKTDASINKKVDYQLPDCDRGPCSQRIAFRHQEGPGIGFTKGYSTFEGFFSLAKDEYRFFTDLRGHVFNDGKWAANAGLGIRKMINEMAIFGINLFYDYRHAPHASHFNQMGSGIELLFKKWDLRANGYVSICNQKHLYQNGFEFSGNSGIFFKKYEQSMQGADLQIGRELFRTRYVDMHATAGGYFFSGVSGKSAAGALLRISARFTPYLSIEGQASYDSVFKGNGWGAIAINIPFGQRLNEKGKRLSCSAKVRLEERFVEKVERFEIVVANTHRKESLALNPTTGLPFHFIFVDNVRGSSDGSFQHPYATLLEAQNNSAPGDVIYVFTGDGTSRGMNQGIILKNNQIFTSSGIPLVVMSSFGNQVIPAQTTTVPIISNINPGGNTVTASNSSGVTVQGFSISGVDLGIEAGGSTGIVIQKNNFLAPLINGIDGTSSTNLLVLQNNFPASLTTGVNGTNSQGLSVANNLFTSSFTTGIIAVGSTNLQVASNIFEAPSTTAIDGTSAQNLSVLNNQFTSSLVTGLIATNSTNTQMTSNTFTANGSLNTAIVATGSSNFLIEQNNFLGPIASEINADSASNLTVLQNNFSSFLSLGFSSGSENSGNFVFTGNTFVSNGSAINIGNNLLNGLNLTVTNNTFTTGNNLLFTPNDVIIFGLNGFGQQGTCNISGNTMLLGNNWNGILIAMGVGANNSNPNYTITINENSISSLNTTSTNMNSGIVFNVGQVSTINTTILENTITNMAREGLLIDAYNFMNTSVNITADIESNQFLNVATAGAPTLAGVTFLNSGSEPMLGTMTIKLYSNTCITDAGMTIPGFEFVNAPPNTLNLITPTGNLTGIAATNPGTPGGASIPTLKIGAVEITPSLAHVNFETVYPPVCNCAPQ